MLKLSKKAIGQLAKLRREDRRTQIRSGLSNVLFELGEIETTDTLRLAGDNVAKLLADSGSPITPEISDVAARATQFIAGVPTMAPTPDRRPLIGALAARLKDDGLVGSEKIYGKTHSDFFYNEIRPDNKNSLIYPCPEKRTEGNSDPDICIPLLEEFRKHKTTMEEAALADHVYCVNEPKKIEAAENYFIDGKVPELWLDQNCGALPKGYRRLHPEDEEMQELFPGKSPDEIADLLGVPEDSWFALANDGYRAEIYKNSAGDIKVTFRGTAEDGDWIDNIQQGAGLPSGSYSRAIELAQAIDAGQNSDRSISFVGHSLGGGLAKTASFATERPATVFNSASIHDNTIESLNNLENHEQKIQDIVVDGDALDIFESGVRENNQEINAGIDSVIFLGGAAFGVLGSIASWTIAANTSIEAAERRGNTIRIPPASNPLRWDGSMPDEEIEARSKELHLMEEVIPALNAHCERLRTKYLAEGCAEKHGNISCEVL